MAATGLPAAVALVKPAQTGVTANAATETACDDVNGNSFANTGVEVVVARASGADQVFTLTLSNTTTKAFTLASGKSYVIGPFDPKIYGTTVVFNTDEEIEAYVVSIAANQNLLTR